MGMDVPASGPIQVTAPSDLAAVRLSQKILVVIGPITSVL